MLLSEPIQGKMAELPSLSAIQKRKSCLLHQTFALLCYSRLTQIWKVSHLVRRRRSVVKFCGEIHFFAPLPRIFLIAMLAALCNITDPLVITSQTWPCCIPSQWTKAFRKRIIHLKVTGVIATSSGSRGCRISGNDHRREKSCGE